MPPPTSNRITLRIFAQDPWSTRRSIPVTVSAGVMTGPVGSRVAVFDYNRDRDMVYEPARPRKNGSFPTYKPADLRFHQLNAYAIVARAVELVELELGRDLQWGFNASRLIVLPHAGYLANAFYCEETHSIQLYSFLSGDEVFHTSLSHDIVAHETGHAILDAVRDRFTEGLHPETAALHEAVADLTAVFAALSYDTVRKQVAGNLQQKNLVSDIAEHFQGDHTALRDLKAGPQPPAYWKKQHTPHDLSLKLTRAVYSALCAMHRQESSRSRNPLAALGLARTALQRMAVRGIDYLPPADATFEDYARALLAADRAVNPLDAKGFRKIVRDTLEQHGVLPKGLKLGPGGTDFGPVPRTWPHLTRGDAYSFLNDNRRELELGRFGAYRDFVVSDVHTTTRPGKQQVDQVIIVYEYPVDIELRGAVFGEAEGYWLSIWGGGALVFAYDGSLRHHARKPVNRERVKQVLTFLKDSVRGGYVATLGSSFEDDVRRHYASQPWSLALSGREATVRSNPSARCWRRSS